MFTGLVPASACVFFRPLNVTDVIGADVAMIGRIESYHQIPRGGEVRVTGVAITVQPILPLFGTLYGERVIYWENSVYSVPETWKGSKTIFIAADVMDADFRLIRGWLDDEITLQVRQKPCAPAFLFDAASLRGVASGILVFLPVLFVLVVALMAFRFFRSQLKRAP